HRRVSLDDEPDGVVERLHGELFLAAEVVVDAALLDAGGLDELAHRGAGVAPLVEDGRRPLEDQPAGGLALAQPGRRDHGILPKKPTVRSDYEEAARPMQRDVGHRSWERRRSVPSASRRWRLRRPPPQSRSLRRRKGNPCAAGSCRHRRRSYWWPASPSTRGWPRRTSRATPSPPGRACTRSGTAPRTTAGSGTSRSCTGA